jgi:AcrR family transcriptional regulator
MGEKRTTPERILDAAEALFADHGFAATSMRRITADAGVNLAAVNYHFGSKDALIHEVFARRLGPLNRERLDLLGSAEQHAGGEPVEIEQIVEAFVGPALRLKLAPGGETFVRLLGHTLSQRDERVLKLFTGEFREVVGRFVAALGRSLPQLAREEIFWRLLFMVGSMAHTLALADRLPAIVGEPSLETGVESTLRRLVPFLTAGLLAPAPRLEGAR